MKLVGTKISETAIYIRYANAPDPVNATYWIDFQLPLEELKDPHHQRDQLGDPERRYLAEIHLAAFRHVREVVGAEIQRLSNLAGRIA